MLPQRNPQLSAPLPHPQGGFTLIEIMVTMGITLLGLAAMLTLHNTVAEGNRMSVESAEASAVAESALEDLRQDSIATLESTYSAVPIDVNLADVQGRNNQVFARRLLVQAVSGSTDLVRLRVEVTWTDSGAAAGADDGIHDHRVVLEELRTREEQL